MHSMSTEYNTMWLWECAYWASGECVRLSTVCQYKLFCFAKICMFSTLPLDTQIENTAFHAAHIQRVCLTQLLDRVARNLIQINRRTSARMARGKQRSSRGGKRPKSGDKGKGKASDDNRSDTQSDDADMRAAVAASQRQAGGAAGSGGAKTASGGSSRDTASAGRKRAHETAMPHTAGGAQSRHDPSDEAQTGGRRQGPTPGGKQSAARRRGAQSITPAQHANLRAEHIMTLDQYGPPEAGAFDDAQAQARWRLAVQKSVGEFVSHMIAPAQEKRGQLAARTMLLEDQQAYAESENTSDDDHDNQGLDVGRRAVRFQVKLAHNVVAAWAKGLMPAGVRKLSDTFELTVTLALILNGPHKYTTCLDAHVATAHEPFLTPRDKDDGTSRTRWRRAFIAAAAATEDFGTAKVGVCMVRSLCIHTGCHVLLCSVLLRRSVVQGCNMLACTTLTVNTLFMVEYV
jgi:hypothetical protein